MEISHQMKLNTIRRIMNSDFFPSDRDRVINIRRIMNGDMWHYVLVPEHGYVVIKGASDDEEAKLFAEKHGFEVSGVVFEDTWEYPQDMKLMGNYSM